MEAPVVNELQNRFSLWDPKNFDDAILLMGWGMSFPISDLTSVPPEGEEQVRFPGQLRQHDNPTETERLWGIAFASFTHRT